MSMFLVSISFEIRPVRRERDLRQASETAPGAHAFYVAHLAIHPWPASLFHFFSFLLFLRVFWD